MKRSQTIATAILAGLSAIVLSSCGSSGGSSGQQPNPNTQNTDLQVGSIGLIPTNTGALGATYPLMVFNNTDYVMVVDSVTASGVAQSIQKNIGSDTTQLFDASMCQQIQPHGSCMVQIKSASLLDSNGIGTNGQYGIHIKSHLKQLNKSYSQDQVIGYQHFNTGSSSGVYYNTSSATLTNITTHSDMGITIPVYFDKAYTNVKVNSGVLGANLVGCGIPNSDGTYNISAKSSCALTTVFQGGKAFSSLITLTTSSAQAASSTPKTTRTISKAHNSVQSGPNNQIMSVSVVNNLNPVALMTTAVVTGFVPTNNTTPVTITFVNVGSSQATIAAMGFFSQGSFIAFNSGSPVTVNGSTTATVTNDTCSSATIQSGNSCQVTFTMNGAVDSGSLDVQMNYATGLGSGTASTFYNIYYYAPTSNVILTSTVSGDLTNTFLYQSQSIEVTVANSSVTNTALDLDNGGVPQLVAIGSPVKPSSMNVTVNSCNQNSAHLLAGQSCGYTVVYTPFESTGGNIINNLRGVMTGTYTNIGYLTTVGTAAPIPYSVNLNSNFIGINPDPLQMLAPVGQMINQTVTITNQTSGSSIGNIIFGINDLDGVSLTNNTCNTNLNYLDSCQVTFVFEPIVQESLMTDIQITFTKNGVPASDVLPANFQASTSAVNVVLANINATQPGLPGGAPAYSGDGESQNSAFSFYNYGDSLQITLTYENTGTEAASNIHMLGDTFPAQSSGYSIQDNCTGQTLLSNTTCTVVATAINPLLASSLVTSGGLNFKIPSMSYTDESEGVSYVKNMFTTPTGNSSMIWVNVNSSVVPIVVVNGGTIVELNGASYYMYPVTIYNSANNMQTVGIHYDVPIPQGASPYGFSDSMNTIPAAGAISVDLSGGQSIVKYLWFPTDKVRGSGAVNLNVSYAGSYPYYTAGFFNPPMVGVSYFVTGNLIEGKWNTGLGSFNSSSTGEITRAVGVSGTVSQLLQYAGYLYAINGDVYSMPITPWNTNTSGGDTYIPVRSSTGALGAATAQTTGYTAGFIAINTITDKSVYAVVVESASMNVHVYSIESGVLTPIGSGTSLSEISANIDNVAIDHTGNLYATVGDRLYFCGTVTAITSCNQVTTAPTFSGSTTTINSITLAMTQGSSNYLSVIPNVADGSGGITPVTQPYYAYAYPDPAMDFYELNPTGNYMGAQAIAINYNIQYGVVAQYIGYLGQTSYTPQLLLWSTDNFSSEPDLSIMSGNIFTYYSFMPVVYDGIIYY